MTIFRALTYSLIVGIYFTATPVSAQETKWELVDTGILTNSAHGKGIEMRIKPTPWVKALFDAPNLPKTMSDLCNHFAPAVIPYVEEKTGMTDPAFISVRLISGGSVGAYVLKFFEVSENGCGSYLE